jgi:hypothetical protein
MVAGGKLVAEGDLAEILRLSGTTQLDDAFLALTGETILADAPPAGA